MSSDNGYVIRQNQFGKFTLQEYFASEDNYPPVITDHKKGYIFNTLEVALLFYANSAFRSEYGLTVVPPSKTEHHWESIQFKTSPALRCIVCGFIWQSHMKKPKVTCAQILTQANPRKRD